MSPRSLWTQTSTLLRRNLLLKLRTPVQSLQELTFPLIFVVVLLVLAQLVPPQTYPAVPSSSAQDPQAFFSANPLLLLFTPNASVNPTAQAVITRAAGFIALKVGQPVDTLGVADPDSMAQVFAASNLSWAGVVFNLEDLSNPQYSIRMNSTTRIPATTTSFNSPATCRITEAGLPTGCPPQLYILSGFMALQAALNRALYEVVVLEGADSGVEIEATVQQMPLGEYQTTDVMLGYIAPIYLVLALSPLFQFLLVNLVVEREKKMLELMQMAGLRMPAFILSWMLTYVVITAVVTLVISLMLSLGGVFPRSDFSVIFLLLFVFGLALISFAFMLAPFFSRAKVAGAVGSLINVLLSVIFVPLAAIGGSTPGTVPLLMFFVQFLAGFSFFFFSSFTSTWPDR